MLKQENGHEGESAFDALMRNINAVGNYAMEVIYKPAVEAGLQTDEPEESWERLEFYEIQFADGAIHKLRSAIGDPVLTHLFQVKRGLTAYRKQLRTNQELMMRPPSIAAVLDEEESLLVVLDQLLAQVDDEITQRLPNDRTYEYEQNHVEIVENLIAQSVQQAETTA